LNIIQNVTFEKIISNLFVMKKTPVLLILLFLPFFFNAFAGTDAPKSFRLSANLSSDDYVAGKIIFKIKPAYRSSCNRSAIAISL